MSGKIYFVGGGPGGRVGRLVFGDRERPLDDRLCVVHGVDDAEPHGLHHEVPDGGRFLRTRQH